MIQQALFEVHEPNILRIHGGDGYLDINIKSRESADYGYKGNLGPAMAIHEDLTVNGGGNFKYVVRSALHKEIRRGDVEKAVRWGRLFARIDGASKVKAYVKNILFEETRNLRLSSEWKTTRGISAEHMVRQITASIKKWQVSARIRDNVFARYVAAYRRALDALEAPLTPQDVDTTVNGTTDLDTLYELFWAVQLRNTRELYVALDGSLRTVLFRSTDNDALTLASQWPKHMYTTKTAIEILCGAWSPDANMFNTEDLSKEVITMTHMEVPEIRDYVYDNHTRPGLARYKSKMLQLVPGAPEPARLDTRWSGLVRGVAWREMACKNGIDIQNVPWEDVSIPQQVWDDVNYVDAFFYPKLYRAAGITNIPMPRD